MVQRLRPQDPVYCARPLAAQKAASWFVHNFPGHVMFAVKTNPAPWALEAVHRGGVRHFDVASIAEVQQVAERFPGCKMSFMHPVKALEAIRRAYHEFGVRDFAFDCHAELDKILRATDDARDLRLLLRMAVDNGHSCLKLSHKFGAEPDEAVGLLRRARLLARSVGVTFHVGSQTMDPQAYVDAMDRAAAVIRKAGVIVDVLDVGGGFPSAYPGMVPPALARFVEAIGERFETMPVAENCELWCEPGRALVATSGSLVVRVELRKGNALYINDGTYGGLFDAGTPRFVYPTRLLRADRTRSIMGPLEPFVLYGPTCDSIDTMPGPFFLPDSVQEGDYIEIGLLGAYSASLRTDFNGFGASRTVLVDAAAPIVADLYEEPAAADADDSRGSALPVGRREQPLRLARRGARRFGAPRPRDEAPS
jgi:ornithine decarboxylase